MKFYIDFDHTLYNTNAFIEEVLNFIANYIFTNGDFSKFPENFEKTYTGKKLIPVKKEINAIKKLLKDNFKRPEETVLGIDYNIYALIDTFSMLFNCNGEDMKSHVNEILANGDKYLFNDVIPFLKNLKTQGHEVYIFSHDRFDLNFQNRKISGSGIIRSDLINATVVSKDSKAKLDKDSLSREDITSITPAPAIKEPPTYIDYEHGIFIDDRPKDLEALFKVVYKNNFAPFNIRIYRMARESGTYSKIPYTSPKYRHGICKIKNLKELTNILFPSQQNLDR